MWVWIKHINILFVYFSINFPTGDQPDVNIYGYPSKKLFKVLRKGTQRGYACMAFNAKGDQLATVGAAPDYMLTVWDWRNETTILKTKV